MSDMSICLLVPYHQKPSLGVHPELATFVTKEAAAARKKPKVPYSASPASTLEWHVPGIESRQREEPNLDRPTGQHYGH